MGKFNIGLDKSGYQVNIFLLHENICCGYSLEAPHRVTSEYPQHIILWRKKKNVDTFGLKKKTNKKNILSRAIFRFLFNDMSTRVGNILCHLPKEGKKKGWKS